MSDVTAERSAVRPSPRKSEQSYGEGGTHCLSRYFVSIETSIVERKANEMGQTDF